MRYLKLSQIYCRTPGLLEHSLRVFAYNSRIVRELPPIITSDQKQDILIASLLHDVGKTTWPDDWFVKPRYSIPNVDWAVMQTHPIQGVNLTMSIGLPVNRQTKTIILNHHERPEGKGYPHGVEPDLPTLIFAACDVFCACTEIRPYRPYPMSELQALDEVAKFAPAVVVDQIKRTCVKTA